MTTSVEIPQGGSPETQAVIDACYESNWQALQPLIAERHKASVFI